MDPILFKVKSNLALLTLNRPEKLNAFTREMALSLQDKLDECQERTDIRCVYLTGSGRAFSAGQDLEEVMDPNGLRIDRILSEHYNPIVKRIRKLTKPVVAAINGIAAGASANIALCCDITVASKSASFTQAFSKIGLIPDSGGTYFLPRLVGWQKASALFMLSEKITAEEAERIGMIYKVLPDEIFSEQSLQIAATLCHMPPRALQYTKQAINHSFINNFEDQLHEEELLQEKAGYTKDFKEGIEAFLQKRKPNFTGE